MITIPQQQLFDRFDTIPDSLREALFDESSVNFIWKTCEDEHLSEENIDVVSKLTGYVYMGFLHPEDLAEEIKEALNIDLRIATAIQDDLNKRIFAPLRGDLDKVYKPLAKNEMSFSGPTILNDISVAPVQSAPKPQPQPISISTATSQTMNASPTIKSAAVPNSNIPPTAPKTNRLSDVGWSRSRSADPVVKLDITSTPAMKPAPVSATAPSAQPPQQQKQPIAPANHALGEFERLNAMKKTPPMASPSIAAAAPIVPGVPKPPMPAPSTSSASSSTPTKTEPAPFMLHQDTSAHAQDKNTDFTLPKPGAGAHVQMNPTKIPVPVRPAVLEFGTSNSSSSSSKPALASTTPQAVHYTQFNASLSSAPTANTGPRNISEVSATATAMPAKVSAPTPSIPVPVPPQPPQQTQQITKEKVIVQDFL